MNAAMEMFNSEETVKSLWRLEFYRNPPGPGRSIWVEYYNSKRRLDDKVATCNALGYEIVSIREFRMVSVEHEVQASTA